jgi:hypothetical protein
VTHNLSGAVDAENYKKVLKQNLVILEKILWNKALELNGLLANIEYSRTPWNPIQQVTFTEVKVDTGWIETTLSSVDTMSNMDLALTGIHISTLLDRLGIAEKALRQVYATSDTLAGQRGEIGKQVELTGVSILTSMLKLTGDVKDPEFDKILKQIEDWPGILAWAIGSDLVTSLKAQRSELQKILDHKPLPSYKDFWYDSMIPFYYQASYQPLDFYINHLEGELQQNAKLNPGDFLNFIYSQKDKLQLLGERIGYLMTAFQLLETYKHLAITDESKKDLFLETEQTLKAFANKFLDLSVVDLTPEKMEEARKKANKLLEDPKLLEAIQDVNDWDEIQDSLLRTAMLIMEVLTVVISIFTGTFAVRAILGTTGSFALRMVISGTAFHLTYRSMRAAIYGEDFINDTFIGDWAETILLFGVLEKGGKLYKTLASPRFAALATKYPKYAAMFKAGEFVTKQATLFTFFQAWTVASLALRKGEFIGPGDEKFWELAQQNALFLAAIQLGMAATRPIEIPENSLVLTDAKLKAKCDLNTNQGKLLYEEMVKWKDGTKPGDEKATEILETAQNLLEKRLELYKEVSAKYPSEISAEQLKVIEATINELIYSIENSLALKQLGIEASGTRPDTFYYKGEFKNIEPKLLERGYEIKTKESTGLVTMKEASGEMVTFVKSDTELPGELKSPVISKVVTDTGYSWKATKESFGSDGSRTANLILTKAWNYKNWRPGMVLPEKYKLELEAYYKSKEQGFIDQYGPDNWSKLPEDTRNMLVYMNYAVADLLKMKFSTFADLSAVARHYTAVLPDLWKINTADGYIEFVTTKGVKYFYLPSAPELGPVLSDVLKNDLALAVKANALLNDPAGLPYIAALRNSTDVVGAQEVIGKYEKAKEDIRLEEEKIKQEEERLREEKEKKEKELAQKQFEEKVLAWRSGLTSKNSPNHNARFQYQIEHCGPKEYLATGSGVSIWADGVKIEDGYFLEAKYIGNPSKSPYIDESKAADFIKTKARNEAESEFERYSKILADPNVPLKGLRVIVSDIAAAPYFEGLLIKYKIPGEVVIKPKK